VSGLLGALTDLPTSGPSHVGFKVASAGRLLEQFVDFADAADTDTITTQRRCGGPRSRRAPPMPAGVVGDTLKTRIMSA
jgi:hypothetical protein